MLYPSAIGSLVRHTRKALESETILAGHSYCSDFDESGLCQTAGCGGDDGVVEPRIGVLGFDFNV